VALIENILLNIKKWHEICQEMFVANAYVSGDVIICSWGVVKSRMIEEKGLSDFMSGIFHQILRGGAI